MPRHPSTEGNDLRPRSIEPQQPIEEEYIEGGFDPEEDIVEISDFVLTAESELTQHNGRLISVDGFGEEEIVIFDVSGEFRCHGGTIQGPVIEFEIEIDGEVVYSEFDDNGADATDDNGDRFDVRQIPIAQCTESMRVSFWGSQGNLSGDFGYNVYTEEL